MTYSRLRYLKLLFGLLSLLLVIQLFNLQVLRFRSYKVLADLQHFRESLVPAKRGQIFSRDNSPLVVNKTSYLLFAEVNNVTDTTKTAKKLADVLFDPSFYDDLEKKKGLGNLRKDFELGLKERIENQGLVWVSLAKKLDQEKKQLLESYKLPGLGFDEEPRRSYPEGTLASFVLGFVGSNENGEEKGYYGIEGFYDGDLKGKSGKVVEEKSASGLPILSGDYKEIKASDGRDLVLTLNRSIQFLVENRLKEGVKKYKAKSGTVIVIDPFTGAIMAMSSYPDFDPGNWENFAKNYSEDIKDRNLIFRNPAISETYEPGSVSKALTISAGVDLGLITPQTEFDDSGPIVASGNTVDNWDKRHYGRQNIIQLLQKSNNIGAAFVGKKLGSERLHDYFVRFGLGAQTGIDLAGEDTGVIKDFSQWRDIDLVTAAFGQGISTTPLQLVSAFSAIANGGVLYKPYIVSRIRDGAETIPFKPVKMRQVLSPDKSRVMIDLLTAAAEGGEGKFFVLKNYRVAGKTGTAQIPVEGRYDPDKTNATFIGFLPNNLKFVMLVRLKEPTSSIYAAETAVPLWMEITKDLTSFFAIPPDR